MKSLSAFLCAVSLCATAAIASGIAEEQVEIEIIKGGYSGETTTSRYWDCCKPTCGWSGNTDTKVGPVKSCAKDGATKIDTNTQSGCEGGTAYMCSNQQSVVINSSLAYGFAAAAFENPPENMCCTCFLITFKKGQWGDCSGKQMVVQITNTGAGSSNTTSNFTNIEIAIPGGGVGYYTTGCSSQWNAPATGWGDQYGGVATEADCNQLPAVLQPGCKFRWEFLNGCSNPPAHFQQVVCPKAIYKLSGCNMGLKDSEG